MNIALITLEGGGIATVCYGLAKSLAGKRIPTTIFTETSGKLESKIVTDSLNVNRLHRVELPPRFFWFQLQNWRYLLNNLNHFSVIHGVSPDASTIVTFYKKKLQKPYVVSFHAEPFSNVRDFIRTPVSSWTPQDLAHQVFEYPLLAYNLKRCAKYADHIVVCSFTALNEFRAVYKNLDLKRVSVIYNAVNLEQVDTVTVKKTFNDNGGVLTILFAGRLYWVKGLSYLLKAFELISKDFKSVRLEIFGTGPEENLFKKTVLNAGLNDQIHFNGRIPNNALIAEIKKADLVVSPSLHEAQSMLVLEAMACMKPVVAFDIPSMKEIITDGNNGVLAKSFSHEDLSEKIRIVLSDRKLRLKLGQNAYNYVLEKHNWNKQVDKYLDIYDNVK
jgi:glycosyltransferase involved in cell wall biosynthesis